MSHWCRPLASSWINGRHCYALGLQLDSCNHCCGIQSLSLILEDFGVWTVFMCFLCICLLGWSLQIMLNYGLYCLVLLLIPDYNNGFNRYQQIILLYYRRIHILINTIWNFLETGHILFWKTSLKKYKRMEIISCILSDHCKN